MRTHASLLTALLVLLLAGCGGGSDDGAGGAGDGRSTRPPVLDRTATPEAGGEEEETEDAPPPLGFPGFATKNTTRVSGTDPIENAAGTALAVYPSLAPDLRPLVVTIADVADWRAAVSAAQLMSRPLRAPILLSERGELSRATRATLEQLDPRGTRRADGAQVVLAGPEAAPVREGFKTTLARGQDAAAVARSIDRLHATAAGAPSRAVIVASSEDPAFAMPAAGLAAKTGAPVLWTNRDRLPVATVSAIESRKRPLIHVVGPEAAVSDDVVRRLRDLGTVRRIAGDTPVENAIAVARFSEGGFGWGVVDPGHGLVFASVERTADAAAAAALSGSGAYGPLLLLDEAGSIPRALQGFLLDIQPGYDEDPVRGVYNHGWLMGDETAISTAVQARIDSLLEIQPVDRTQ